MVDRNEQFPAPGPEQPSEALRLDIQQGYGDEPKDVAEHGLTTDDPIDAEASVIFDTVRRERLGFYEDV